MCLGTTHNGRHLLRGLGEGRFDYKMRVGERQWGQQTEAQWTNGSILRFVSLSVTEALSFKPNLPVSQIPPGELKRKEDKETA